MIDNNFSGVATYVVKVASRCNLNCSYCYMYNMGDDTFMNQPKKMSSSTVENFALKLKEHINEFSLKEIIIAFHGGEPMLWGIENIIDAKNKINNVVKGKARLSFAIQTNGVLLDDDNTKLLTQNGIYIGVSIDGVKEVHDKYRVDHKGRGSFDKIISNFDFIRKYQKKLSLITVLSLDIDPIEYYEFLLSQNVHNINLILLEANYDKLPSGYSSIEDLDNVYYGKWLAKLFDFWVEKIGEKRIEIDLFELILGLLMGRDVGNQGFGRKHNDVITIETDGAIETVDILRITESGITRNDLNINKHSIKDILQEDIFNGYYFAHKNICATCSDCDFKNICGGGMYVHRYKTESGFDNPSVYCKDIQYIINHINDYLVELSNTK